ncbi:hypothetical protein X760_18305 [Mesorhizobium sp. LSHC422A00]|nr:hypothetical protein X760_18305 [Mesorhizobium sp. LSHC422A00]
MLRINARLADPFGQHVLMEIKIAGRPAQAQRLDPSPLSSP